MKNKIIAFMSVMMVMLMTTGAVFAATISETQNVPYSTFSDIVEGDQIDCTIGGNSSKIYVYGHNKWSSTRYITTQIREYKYNYGWTSNTSSDGESVTVGNYTYLEISRDISMEGYYHYVIKSKDNQYTPAVYDEITYKAIQTNSN